MQLEHRNLARFGVVARQLREAVNASNGWELLLSNFAAVAERWETSASASA